MITVTFDNPKQVRETYFENGEQIVKVEAGIAVKTKEGCRAERLSYNVAPIMTDKAIYNLVVEDAKVKFKGFEGLDIIIVIFGNRKVL